MLPHDVEHRPKARRARRPFGWAQISASHKLPAPALGQGIAPRVCLPSSCATRPVVTVHLLGVLLDLSYHPSSVDDVMPTPQRDDCDVVYDNGQALRKPSRKPCYC